MMVTTEMMLGGMNKNRIGHDDQDNGDGDESEEVHGGVVFPFNAGVRFGIGGPLDCGKRNCSNKRIGINRHSTASPCFVMIDKIPPSIPAR